MTLVWLVFYLLALISFDTCIGKVKLCFYGCKTPKYYLLDFAEASQFCEESSGVMAVSQLGIETDPWHSTQYPFIY